MQNTLLNEPVHNRGYSEGTGFSVILWYFHSADSIRNIPVQLALNMGDQSIFVPFVQIAYCLIIYTRRPNAAVLSDISLCQLDVFRAFYQFHKIAEPLPLDTCGIQFVKSELHIVVFGIADFLFLQGFLLVCQSQVLSSLYGGFRFS